MIAHRRNHTTGVTAGNAERGICSTGARWYCDCGQWEYPETDEADRGLEKAKRSHGEHVTEAGKRRA